MTRTSGDEENKLGGGKSTERESDKMKIYDERPRWQIPEFWMFLRAILRWAEVKWVQENGSISHQS